jgi:hypothetical protein
VLLTRNNDDGKVRSRQKFEDPDTTAKGEPRAVVGFERLDTLWFNTGTLCNIACQHCYIESTPTNDRLTYLTLGDVLSYVDEAGRLDQRPRTVGFTGGEPFMNPAIADIIDAVLARGHDVLVLTNAMKPMMRPRMQTRLLALNERYGAKLTLRVSLDHWRGELHEDERGALSFVSALRGLKWLTEHGFAISVAGRLRWGDVEADMRRGYAALFARLGIDLDALDSKALILFPEMDESAPVPEITEACWGILNKRPSDLMCASSRMIVKRRGAERPSVVACTLLPYDARFDFGADLMRALAPVKLNHPHCAKFCVLGGGSCSG